MGQPSVGKRVQEQCSLGPCRIHTKPVYPSHVTASRFAVVNNDTAEQESTGAATAAAESSTLTDSGDGLEGAGGVGDSHVAPLDLIALGFDGLLANELDALGSRYGPLTLVVASASHVRLDPAFRDLAEVGVGGGGLWAKWTLRMQPSDPDWDRGPLVVEGISNPAMDPLGLIVAGEARLGRPREAAAEVRSTGTPARPGPQAPWRFQRASVKPLAPCCSGRWTGAWAPGTESAGPSTTWTTTDPWCWRRWVGSNQIHVR